MVNRRKFLIGLGTVSTGSAAAFGTAASTTFNVNDRKVGANITTDSAGAVALTDQGNAGDIINETDGELEIDFAQGRASGVNVGSVVSVGNGNVNKPEESAFTITNQTTAPIDLDIQFEAGNDYSANEDGSKLLFNFAQTNFSPSNKPNKPRYVAVTADKFSTRTPPKIGDTFANGVLVSDFDSPGDTGSVSYQRVPAGGTALAQLTVYADEPNSDPSENLSGVLNLTANQV
jgi:hypothetical protein